LQEARQMKPTNDKATNRKLSFFMFLKFEVVNTGLLAKITIICGNQRI
jgi:hypothetical protein